MSFPRYPAYKGSGVEWLGEVPEHWNLVPIKRILQSIEQGWSPQCEAGPAELGEWGVLKVGCVNGGKFNPDENKALPRELLPDERLAIRGGDVLVSRANTRELVGSVAMSEMDYPNILLCDKLYRLRTKQAACFPAFLARYLVSDGARNVIETSASGASSSMLNIGQSVIVNMPIALPPACEQADVVHFLDRETAKIDALIAEQQRLIELLQEKRQAVISHAVTKGLNPDAPMKDSGVEWLGEVPEHWTVMPLRLDARIESGHTPSRSREDYWVAEECIYPWFTLGDVWQIRDERTEYVFETQEKVSQIGLENSAARLLPANTVILSRTASVGFSGILGIPMATTQDFVNWICGPRICPEYLLFVFRAMAKEFERLKYGSTHNTIYMPDIFSFRTPVPPLDEQRQIVSMVRESLCQLDGSFDDLSKSQELLQERCSALISAAVTGQIDVRGLVPEASAA